MNYLSILFSAFIGIVFLLAAPSPSNAITCGDGIVEIGQDCDPVIPQSDICCNPVTCLWSAVGSSDPQGVCNPNPGPCSQELCDGAGGCFTETVSFDGTACNTTGICTDGICWGPLLYGDADYDQEVDIDDASAMLDTLLGGPCRLANVAVSDDVIFGIPDVLLLAQYVRGLRTANEVDGDWMAPFSLVTNSGNGQIDVPGSTLAIPLTTLATHRVAGGLCNNPALFTQTMEIISDTTGGATLTYGVQTGTAFTPVGFDGLGYSFPVMATLGPSFGQVTVRARRYFSRPDGSIKGSRSAYAYLFAVPPNCGNGLLDAGEACDEGAANGTNECGCDLYCSNYPVAGSPCGEGIAEPTCNPDVCDGAGLCIDVPIAPCNAWCWDNGGDSCLDGYCLMAPFGPGSWDCWGFDAIPTARKGTHASHIRDFNNGMTSGLGGPTDVFAILPNDPSAANHGTDMVVFDITIPFGPLWSGDVVYCTIGGIPANNNCEFGDSVCVGWGAYPQITGWGINTTQQECLALGSPGVGASIAPDEMDTAIATDITCDINGNIPITQNITVNMGFAGARDQEVPAGTTTVDVDFFSYCSSGADGAGGSEFCGANFGGSPLGVDRGIQLVDLYFYYDGFIFDQGVIGEIKPPLSGRDAANPYLQPPQGCAMTPTGTCSPVDALFGCVDVSPGIGRFTGYVIPCNGTIMLYGGSCRLGASVAPQAGTVSWVNVTVLDVTGTVMISDNSANAIRGIDLDGLAPLPSTNVAGYIIWN